MAEYIDREEIKEWTADWLRNDKCWHPYSKGKNIPTTEVFDMLSLIPAADVQPVKHGQWVIDNPEQVLMHCSNCKWRNLNWKWKYCPYCGAKMDGET